jgi:hypothetical protein
VTVAARDKDDYVLFNEDFNYCATDAFELLAGPEEDFYEALAHDNPVGQVEEKKINMGEDFDFDDTQQMRLRLPRLAALYLPGGRA